jgi:hypothetical protein
VAVLADLLVKFGADSSQFRDALASVEADLKKFPKDVQAATEKAAGATAIPLAKFKEGLSRSREAAMFFTSSLREFGPAGQTAQIALSGIVGAALGGGGVLFVLEGIRVAVRLATEAWKASGEEIRKAKEDLKKYAAEAEAAAVKLAAARARARGDEVAAVKVEVGGDLKAARQAYAEARAALAAYIREQGLLVGSNGRVLQASEAQYARIAALEEAIKAKRTDLLRLHSEGQKKTTDVVKTEAEKQTKKTEDELAKQVAAAKKHAAAMKQALAAAHRPDTSGLPTVAGFFDLEAAGYDPVAIARAEVERYGDELAKAQERAKTFAAATTSAVMSVVQAWRSGTNAIEALFESLLSTFTSMMSRMMEGWLQAAFMPQVAGGIIPGASGGGVTAPQLITPAAGKLASSSQAVSAAPMSVHLTIAGDVVDPEGWFEKNRGALAGQISRLSYLGRTG